MSLALAVEFTPQTTYDDLAEKLDEVARIVRKNPNLDPAIADRLNELAGQIRQDTQREGPKPQSKCG
jgi:predicted transcriptional regulator